MQEFNYFKNSLLNVIKSLQCAEYIFVRPLLSFRPEVITSSRVVEVDDGRLSTATVVLNFVQIDV